LLRLRVQHSPQQHQAVQESWQLVAKLKQPVLQALLFQVQSKLRLLR
jgi:hypothetical protein